MWRGIRKGPYCQKLYFVLNGLFAANLTLFHTLAAWICIQREFGNFTIFCWIFCRLVEIYYWLLQNQCSGSRSIGCFWLISDVGKSPSINLSSLWPADLVQKHNSNLTLQNHGVHSLQTNTSEVKNQPKIQFLALRSLSIFHVTYVPTSITVHFDGPSRISSRDDLSECALCYRYQKLEET